MGYTGSLKILSFCAFAVLTVSCNQLDAASVGTIGGSNNTIAGIHSTPTPIPTATPSSTHTPTPTPTVTVSPTATPAISSRVVMVGYGGRRMTSLNGGTTWAYNTVDVAEEIDDIYGLRAIHFANNLFVTVGFKMMSTADGITWTTVLSTLPGNGWLGGITYGNGKWVAVGGEGLRMVSTNNTASWSSNINTMPYSSHLRQVAFGGGIFLAVGDNGIQSHSTDGVTWSTVNEFSNSGSDSYGSLVFGGSRFYALDTSTSRIVQSAVADGTNSAWTPSWSAVSTLPSGTYLGITYVGGKYYASSTSAIFVSTDATTWTTYSAGSVYPVIPQGGKYLTYSWNNLDQSSNLTSWSGVGTTLTPPLSASGATASIVDFAVSP